MFCCCNCSRRAAVSASLRAWGDIERSVWQPASTNAAASTAMTRTRARGVRPGVEACIREVWLAEAQQSFATLPVCRWRLLTGSRQMPIKPLESRHSRIM